MNRIGRRSLYVIAALAVIALVTYALMPSPLRVEFAQAVRGPLQVTIDEDGEVRAHDRYVVAAPVAGRLARIALLEGDAVRAAQVVARIAPAPMSSRERDEQLARVSAAESLVREAQERAGHADADYAQARRERQRVESLVQKAFLSPQALEQARVAETTSQNEARAARFRADSAAAEARAARAGLLALQPDKAGALVDVPAPVAGSVLRVLEKSERVIAAGTPLLVVGDPARYEVVVDVLSTDAVNIRPGMRMLLTGWGRSKTLEARVRIVEPAAFTKVSALGVEEQRVNVVADFVDPPGPDGAAEIGLDALDAPRRVRFEAQHHHRRGVGGAGQAEAVGVLDAHAVDGDDALARLRTSPRLELVHQREGLAFVHLDVEFRRADGVGQRLQHRRWRRRGGTGSRAGGRRRRGRRRSRTSAP
jgi:HlyD family secretion protein